MNIPEMFRLALANLWRTKIRTFLTVLGVIIGIAALSAMVSFGTGMEKNITDTFKSNDLFTSLTVTSGKIDLNRMTFEPVNEDSAKKAVPLNDSLIAEIKKIKEVKIVYPEQSFPVRLEMDNHSINTTIQAIPMEMGQFSPYNNLVAGTFFKDDSSLSVIINKDFMRRLKVIVTHDPSGSSGKGKKETTLSRQDSTDGFRIVPADSLIGKKIKIHTAAFNMGSMPGMGEEMPSGNPVKELTTELVITGIIEKPGTFNPAGMGGNVYIPIRAAKKIPRLDFRNVWDLLNRKRTKSQYSSLYIRVEKTEHLNIVRPKLEKMKLKVFSLADELKEIKRGFLIMDSILGAIGTIALIVAGLGIVNTMVMSIMERTKEIGIMKAIGGSEGQIKMIFFVEAGTIGFLGGVLGLLLGWGVTKIANIVVNARFLPTGEDPVNLFYFPLWLSLGAIAFSVLVSLAAGLYPASRAARIDPVKALRRE